MSAKKSNTIKSMHSRLKDIPIAIIGMSAIFPESKNLQAYWDNIINEVDCIIDVPPSRWNIDDYYDPDPKAEDKTYCKRGGFIPDIDFDPMEFGLPPNILEVTDVHQLISLILAKEVLKDGGYENATDQQKKDIGVILGVGGGQKAMWPLISRLQYPVWEKVLKSSGLSDSDTHKIIGKIKKAYVGWEENSFPGALGNVIAGRIANRLNLGGTNCVVDAACASALSGIRMAVSELLEYRADMMITGGVDTDNSAYMYLCFSKTQAFSKGEKSTPFDNDTDGMLIGEGIGMVLLKRLEDAERDNDRIYAVIKGMGSSSDGKFKSIYAPRPEGQVLALSRAYEDAGISPSTIGMLEAHGTGTSAGDIAEIKALKSFFAEHDSEKQHIAMGSVKSQIGHIKNAAGSASLVKTALALYHKILPATINVKEPNKEFDLENSPFYLNTQVRPWIRAESDTPRRAGVSAFGFGGTNFHFVLEEHTREMSGSYRLNSVAQPILLSATKPDKLIAVCENAVIELASENKKKYFRELIEKGKTADIPLEHARIGFVAESEKEAVELLKETISNLKENPQEESWNLPTGIHFQKRGIDPKGKVVALFAGQGSPYLNMGKELVSNFPPLMKYQSQMDELFIRDNLKPLSQVVFPMPVFDKALKKDQEKKLQLTEHAQPAIGVFCAGQYQLLKNAGFKPDFTAGHSFGELTALWAADVFNTEDYLMLAKARGKAMAAPNDPNFDAGSMLAVMGEIENLQMEIEEFPEITIANYNSRNQVVLAGPTNDIKEVQKFLKKRDYRTVLLGVSAAFHTKLMGHAQKPFAETISSVKFGKPTCKVYSNASGEPYATAPKTIQTTLQDHILNSVLFKQEIENIYNDGGYFFVEFGPQSILSRLVENILKDKPFISVALNANARRDSDRQYREAVVKLKVAGLSLKDIDPYELIPEITEKKKNAMTLKLSGTNYVSEKTKTIFEEALQDGHQIQAAVSAVASPQLKEQMSYKQQTEKPVTVQHAPVDLNNAMISMERGLANFYNHQNETLRIHEQFLNNQSEYSRSFFQIMQIQAQAGPSAASNDVTQSITQFHVHQGETLRVHEQYLRHQTEYSKQSFELIRQQQATLTGEQVPRISQVPVTHFQPRVYPPPAQLERQTPIFQAPAAFTPSAQPVQQLIQP
ncbi:acyltransferase domain-containing protein, partial [bacterium]|nr:acyltransferase domain-containing protein [bacterium]